MHALPAAPPGATDEVARLRARIERIERRNRVGSDARVLPAPASITGLLPGGGLRAGAVYTLDRSMPLLLELLAAPSRAGAWCAVIGMPELGVEAALAAGAELDRVVLIPRPGDRWLGVTAAVAEVMGLVALRPAAQVRPQEAQRLAARLRERGTVLLVQGQWPHAEAALRVEDPQWSGLGDGHGHLQRLDGEVVVALRQGTRRRRTALLDEVREVGEVGEVRRADGRDAETATDADSSGAPGLAPLRRVG